MSTPFNGRKGIFQHETHLSQRVLAGIVSMMKNTDADRDGDTENIYRCIIAHDLNNFRPKGFLDAL